MKRTKRIRRLCCTLPLVLSAASSSFLPVLADENDDMEEVVIEDNDLDIEENDTEDSSDEIETAEEEELIEETIVEDVYDVTDSIEDGIYQIQACSNNNFVLDVDGDKSDDGTNIYIYTNTNSHFTRWKIEHQSDGYVSIMNLGSKKALDANGAKTDNGTNIQLWTPNTSDAQRWKILSNGDGTYRIASKMNTSKVLDVDCGNMINETNVQLWDYVSSSKGQKWKFVKWTCPHDYKHLRTDTTEKLDHVRANVLIQAYDEPVYEKHTYVVCNGCGAKFNATSEWTAHNKPFALQGDGTHGSYSVKTESVKTGTIHHDAVVEYYNVYIVSYKFWNNCDICDDVILYNTAESTREEKIDFRGWIKLDSYWYYVSDDGTFYKGWLYLNDIWYYLDSEGHMVVGWKEVDGKWYYFDGSGHMVKGWNEINGYWYYMDEHGVTTYGWRKIDEQKYYFDDHAHMVTGWQEIDGCWYYFNAHGVMQTGWMTINEKTYFLGTASETEGQMFVGLHTIGGKKYYFDDHGVMQVDWQSIDGNRYFFGTAEETRGQMFTGFHTIGGKKYYFSDDGIMQTGWMTIDGNRYFFGTAEETRGQMFTGFHTIGGKKYYFSDDGIMQTGWMTIDGNQYFFGTASETKGEMFVGLHTIGGKKYYFNSEGHLIDIKSVSLNIHEIELKMAGTYKLEAKVEPSDISEIQKIQWTTSDDSVVTVDENGNLKATGSGTAVITAETVTGLIDTCNVIVTAPQQKLTGYSITAGSEIGLNYHFDMDSSFIENEPYILFAVDGRTQKSYPSLNDKGEYVFTVSLNYKEMNTPVSAVFVCGSDIKNLETYSIQDYVEAINEHSNEYEKKYVDIANAMLNCGYRIQDYFDYKTDLKRISLNVEQLNIPDDYKGEPSRIDSFIGSRLVLKSKMKLKLYFSKDDSVKVNGISMEMENEENYRVTTIDDISPLNIGESYQIDIDGKAIEYGVLNYCWLAQNSGREELVDMAKAIYTFYRVCID